MTASPPRILNPKLSLVLNPRLSYTFQVSQTPKYGLNSIQQLCASGDRKSIWFSAPSRSITKVVEEYATTDAPKSNEEAVEFILQGLLALKPEDFVERLFQWSTVADVYGLIFDGRPWYVKFIFENAQLEEISFHRPEKPMKTVGGKTVG